MHIAAAASSTHMEGIDAKTLSKHPSSLRHTPHHHHLYDQRVQARNLRVFWGEGDKDKELRTAPSLVGCTTRVIPSQQSTAKYLFLRN